MNGCRTYEMMFHCAKLFQRRPSRANVELLKYLSRIGRYDFSAKRPSQLNGMCCFTNGSGAQNDDEFFHDALVDA
jgi:hypothetical protein